MTFLNPLYLIGLAAAAIPIILHLLTLRKARIVEFSTLTFLKELQRNRIRKLKIRQWLLLALRTLIIIFAVLAFTRPAMRSSFGFLPGTQAKSSVVIVIDDSFSMYATDERGPLIKQARTKALEVLDMLHPGDEVAILRLSEARKETHRFTAAMGAARDAVAAIEPSFHHVQMAEALTAASALLSQSRNINRELYVITDEQRTHFTAASARTPLFDPSIRSFVIPLGAKAVGNSAVADVRIENSLFEKDKPVDISATIVNNTGTALTGALVSVFLDGERVAQKGVDAAPGQHADVRVSVTPKRAGFIRGYVELEDDDIPEDNVRYFALYVPEKLRILLAAASAKDAQILRLAMQPSEEAAALFAITSGDAGSISSANLGNFDAVVVAGAAGISTGAAQRLASWVHAGGGLLLLPDSEGPLDAFTALVRDLGLPAPAGVSGAPNRTSQFTSFNTIDYDHPLFRGVFSQNTAQAGAVNTRPRIESPRVYCSVRLRSSADSRDVITTSGGDVFLVDQRTGSGRALVMAVPANLSWSDFPLRGVFVPLIHRSLYYLAAREDNVRTGLIGSAIDLNLPPMASSTWDLRTPDDAQVRLAPRTLASGLAFSLRDLDVPGIYELRADSKPLRALAVNLDPAESDLARIDAEQRENFYRSYGLPSPVVLAGRTDVRTVITEARFGVELWKYMLALALLCAIAEMLVARDVRHRQDELQGTAPHHS